MHFVSVHLGRYCQLPWSNYVHFLTALLGVCNLSFHKLWTFNAHHSLFLSGSRLIECAFCFTTCVLRWSLYILCSEWHQRSVVRIRWPVRDRGRCDTGGECWGLCALLQVNSRRFLVGWIEITFHLCTVLYYYIWRSDRYYDVLARYKMWHSATHAGTVSGSSSFYVFSTVPAVSTLCKSTCWHYTRLKAWDCTQWHNATCKHILLLYATWHCASFLEVQWAIMWAVSEGQALYVLYYRTGRFAISQDKHLYCTVEVSTCINVALYHLTSGNKLSTCWHCSWLPNWAPFNVS